MNSGGWMISATGGKLCGRALTQCSSSTNNSELFGSVDGVKGLFAVAAVVVAACTPASVDPAPAPTPIVASAEPRAAVEVPGASSSAEQPVVAPPSVDVPDASRVRRPKVSSSPRQIECHDVVCDLATELCCQSHDAGTCIPRDKPEGCNSLELLWKYCDETADCEKGSACCYAPRPDPTVYATNECRKGDCTDPAFERCLPGGKCSRGRKCRVSDDAYEGYCH